MKNPVKKILALVAAAAVSATFLCTAVSAEEYDASAVNINLIAEENTESIESIERAIDYTGTYSSGSSYVTLRSGGTCYFHVVLTGGKYIRANGTYATQGTSFRASCSSYLIVNSDGSTEPGGGAIGVDGSFNKSGTVLTISSIEYYKD